MKKIVIYGHKNCPDCKKAVEYLAKKNVKFAYQDTSESLKALKDFANYRESRPEFAETKKNGGIGFPCIVVNGGEEILLGCDEKTLDKL
jgi:glutaredoxin-related protein